eukprot:TRINITY_DN6340_c1_g1_i3.p1 TRINITY_DN6340_c1_g1~~TRINITY_DN6340_c1_g1_i3.p1  ORF type:complete len:104 (+),score=13.85 TRINITY_DN6340_c1_g1_i3:321-632(+)
MKLQVLYQAPLLAHPIKEVVSTQQGILLQSQLSSSLFPPQTHHLSMASLVFSGILAHTSPKEEIAAHQAGIEERISDFPQETSRGRSKRKTEDQFIVHQNIRS